MTNLRRILPVNAATAPEGGSSGRQGFQAGTSKADLFTLDTPEGRARIFKERIDELTRPKSEGGKGLTLDAALFEMRTGDNPDDNALLSAMGERPSHFRTEQLTTEKRNRDLDRLAQENLAATKTSKEVAAASRKLAVNSRIDELHRKGFSTDQAILQMQANPKDAELLKAMAVAYTHLTLPTIFPV